jgi:riboflavin-specific deaminase-like protein
MEFRRIHPDPQTVDSAEQFANLGLNERVHHDRPYLVTNFAATADGRATVDGRSGGIGDDGDMEVFRRLRTQVDALLVGTHTLAVERYGRAIKRPELRAAREAIGLKPEPLVVTVSRSGEVPLDIPLFQDPDAHVALFTTPQAPEPACPATVHVTRLEVVELTFTTVLRQLRAEHDVRSALCEGGPTIMSALLGEGLVDELFLTLAPQLVGGGGAPTIASGEALADPAALTLVWALERNGSLFLRYALGHRLTAQDPV